MKTPLEMPKPENVARAYLNDASLALDRAQVILRAAAATAVEAEADERASGLMSTLADMKVARSYVQTAIAGLANVK